MLRMELDFGPETDFLFCSEAAELVVKYLVYAIAILVFAVSIVCCLRAAFLAEIKEGKDMWQVYEEIHFLESKDIPLVIFGPAIVIPLELAHRFACG